MALLVQPCAAAPMKGVNCQVRFCQSFFAAHFSCGSAAPSIRVRRGERRRRTSEHPFASPPVATRNGLAEPGPNRRDPRCPSGNSGRQVSFRFISQSRSVSRPDRARRVCSVDRIASRTSSYPSSSAWERPTCRACLTAATGGGAPSNRRVGLHHTSCSYEQPPPGRERSHG